MIETPVQYDHGKLLAPWKHGDELDDTVFRIAAAFSLQFVTHHDYQMPGDYLFPFDVNAFIQRLVEETGIAHTWEPVQIRVSEGGRCWVMNQPEVASLETKAVVETRQLLWMVWERCSGGLVDSPLKRHPEAIAGLFADFLKNLARCVPASSRNR